MMALYPFFWQTTAGLFRGTLSWELTLPPLLTVLLALVFAALLGLQWRQLRGRVPRLTRWGLCVLRGMVYLLILGLILNPTLLIQKVLRLLPPLAVLVDTSGSMALPAEEDTTRLQQALAYLQRGEPPLVQALAERYQLKLYQFHEAPAALPLERLAEVTPGGNTTDLLGSLAAVLDTSQAARPVGVLLLSDGAHHGAATGLDYLRQAGIPVVALGAGNPATYRDIRVGAVTAPTLAFLHYPVEVKATIQAWGYAGERLPVVLQREGQVVATVTVPVTTDPFVHDVHFEIVPDALGEFTYTVSVAPRLGEALTANNRRDFPLTVARDKIRVLLVCGSPTWNYRFLRQALKHDPSIDLVSFVILRTPTDVVNVPESQLSLIPFPTRRLFTEELKNFDLLIFENFSFQYYFPWYYLENVRKYVLEGGAFAMIGGPLAFAQGGYAETPIEELLPVSLQRGRTDYREVTHRLVLTAEGQTHPITRLAADPEENQRIWESLPELDALNVLGRAKPGATVLGVSSQRFNGEALVPLLAVQPFGKGRTLALASDYIWKWNFQMAGRMDSNQYYLQFVRQLVRWLVRDPALNQVRIRADASAFPLGSEVGGTVQVLRDDYRPAAAAEVRIALHTPGGAVQPLPAAPTGNRGEFRYRFRAEEEGFYRLEVTADVEDRRLEGNRLLVHVFHPGDETQQAAPNHALLRDIAEQTGGAFFSLSEGRPPSAASLAEFFGGTVQYRVLEERRLHLRETWLQFLIVLGLLAAEWGWRRRAGLF
ncbi:MAG: membrane protein [Candidatus Tectimicrobiota bacterium]|nr:MAG: membrane protein [Candidatus Tectomicrobia bacterium]